VIFLRIIEASLILLVTLLMFTICATIPVGVKPRARVIGGGRILAWLDAKGYLKGAIYTKDIVFLQRTIGTLVCFPYKMEVYNTSSMIFELSSGTAQSYEGFSYMLTGVNGSIKPLIVVLKVSCDE